LANQAAAKLQFFRKPIEGLFYDVLMPVVRLTKVVEIALFLMYSIGFRSGSKVEENNSIPSLPVSTLHPQLMAIQIVRHDNIVSCIEHYHSLSPERRDLERAKFTLTLPHPNPVQQVESELISRERVP
jgi:hypothetical protein